MAKALKTGHLLERMGPGSVFLSVAHAVAAAEAAAALPGAASSGKLASDKSSADGEASPGATPRDSGEVSA